jgi:hypothetical protein
LKAFNLHQKVLCIPLHFGVVLPVELRVVKTSSLVVLAGAASVDDAAWVVGAIDEDEMPGDSAKSVVDVWSAVLDSVLVSVQISASVDGGSSDDVLFLCPKSGSFPKNSTSCSNLLKIDAANTSNFYYEVFFLLLFINPCTYN